MPATLCSLCSRARGRRLCPALGRFICAPCCGAARETTVDCPDACPHLRAAQAFEQQQIHPETIEPAYPQVRVHKETLQQHAPLLVALSQALTAPSDPLRATDNDARQALEALTETCRTRAAGILYEQPPANPTARLLYQRLAAVLEEYRQNSLAGGGVTVLRDSQALEIVVFLLRLAVMRTNGRPRARAFLRYLADWLPGPSRPETARRIVLA
jgi:hypothetical protein